MEYQDLPKFITEPNPDVYLSNNYVVLDFETTNNDHGSPLAPTNRLVLAVAVVGSGHSSYRPGPGRRYIKWGGEFEQQHLLGLIRSSDFFVAHHSKFELGWLARVGQPLRECLPYCTQIGEYVLLGNRKAKLGLDAIAERKGLGAKLGSVSRLIKLGMSTEDIPRRLLEDYCIQDVELTERLFLHQREELRDSRLLPVAYCRNLVTPVLADIETRGMCLDKDNVIRSYEERIEKYAKLSEEFDKFTGGINPRSGKQLGEYIYGKLEFAEPTNYKGAVLKTGAGKPKTDKGTLGNLVAKTPEQKTFKKLVTALTKMKIPVQNLKKMKAVLDKGDDKVYAQFNQTVTQTHRLSSSGRKSGFQFHNFDREFKPLFRARNPEWLVVEGDAPQLEFRVAAQLGGDSQAIQSIISGEDIHAFTASILYPKEDLKTARQKSKAHTFKPLYGGMSGTPREKQYYQAFREKYARIYDTQRSWCFKVLEDKKLVTPWGLVFYWPDTKMKDGGYITNTPSIFNYPVQSFATADIIPLVLTMVWHRMKDMQSFLVNTIHDSIIGEVPPAELDEYTGVLVQCFTKDIYKIVKGIYGIDIKVPLGVGIKAGQHWGTGVEQKFESTTN